MNDNPKIRVAVLAGARSTEHEVSLVSAYNIVNAIDREKYDVYVVGISKDGVWRQYDPSNFVNNPEGVGSISLTDNPVSGRLAVTQHSRAFYDVDNGGTVVFECDVVFPAVLGNYAEDGTMQGLLRMMDVPFTTADVLGSAVGMDKDVAYRLLRDAGLKVADFVTLRKHEAVPSFDEIAAKLSSDVLFVKPANTGSSVGVSRTTNADEFAKAVELAFRYDTKLVIQKGVKGREVEISVIGQFGAFETSKIGEIVEKDPDDFYSYDNKYIHSDNVELIAPADVNPEVEAEIKRMAMALCDVLECEGFGRVDFFVDDNNDVYINEINTMPGFTSISMFPRLWGVSGVDYPALVDRLLQIAIKKYDFRIAPMVLDADEVMAIAKQSGAA
jgi:D-alanine-D-alanine ligase